MTSLCSMRGIRQDPVSSVNLHACSPKAPIFTKAAQTPQKACRSRKRSSRIAALGDSGSGCAENKDDKKFITREEEPDQFWQTKNEAKGRNPAKDPLAIIGILGLLIPFVILGIAIGTGVVDVNAGRP